MDNFTFYNPARIHFGKGQIAALANEIPINQRVLITYGSGSIKGLADAKQILRLAK